MAWPPCGGDPLSYAKDCTRLYTRRGRVAHLQPPFATDAWRGGVLCPVVPSWPGSWLGTGSQREYERAASLPLCAGCSRIASAGRAR